MATTKLSISVDPSLAQFIDTYQADNKVPTKSEVVERALKLLQKAELQREYAEAYAEWQESGEAAVWEATVDDGLGEPSAKKASRKGKR